MRYFFDRSETRDQGFFERGFETLPKDLREVEDYSVIVFHWKNWNLYGFDVLKRNEKNLIFLFISGSSDDIGSPEIDRDLKKICEKGLAKVLPNSKIFYYKVSNHEKGIRVLDAYLEYLSRRLGGKKIEGIESPQDFNEKDKPKNVVVNMFLRLLKNFFLSTMDPEKVPEALRNCIPPISDCNKYWQPFKNQMEGKEIKDIFSGESIEFQFANTVLQEETLTLDVFNDIKDINIYQKQLLSDLCEKNDIK